MRFDTWGLTPTWTRRGKRCRSPTLYSSCRSGMSSTSPSLEYGGRHLSTSCHSVLNLPALSSESYGQPLSGSCHLVGCLTGLLPELHGRLPCGSCRSIIAFNRSIAGVVRPAFLQQLSFGGCFNQPIVGVTWPTSLRLLSLGHGASTSPSLELHGGVTCGTCFSGMASTSPSLELFGRPLCRSYLSGHTSTSSSLEPRGYLIAEAVGWMLFQPDRRWSFVAGISAAAIFPE